MNDSPVIPLSMRTHDNTMMSAWARCPRWYEIRHNRGLTTKGQPSAALAYGSLVHEGLAMWYKTKNKEATAQTMIDAEYPELEIEEFRTRERAIRKVFEYIGYYEEHDMINDVILNETPFELVSDDGFRWGGRMDLLVRYKGSPWVVDHKTTARFQKGFFEQFKNSNQMAGYVWAATQMHGEPVKGVIINCIVTHKIPKPIEGQVHRQPILFPEYKVEEWKRTMINRYQEIHRAHLSEYFPPCWDNCVNKYGKCSAFDICSVPEKNREDMLALNFEEDHWDWMDDA